MNKKYLLIVLLAVVVAILAGLISSSLPDGLEKASKSLGFADKTKAGSGIFIDYQLSAFPFPALSTIISGILGIIILVFIFKSISNATHIGEFLKKILSLEKNK